MGHTYTNLLYHGVFSTRCRRPTLNPATLPVLVKVVGGIDRDRDGALLAMNGTENHVHLLAAFHPKHSVSDMFRDIKAISCDWLHTQGRAMAEFHWQEGYSAFTVSRSNREAVDRYIANQVEHHRTRSFEDELLALLRRHGVVYDPLRVFD